MAKLRLPTHISAFSYGDITLTPDEFGIVEIESVHSEIGTVLMQHARAVQVTEEEVIAADQRTASKADVIAELEALGVKVDKRGSLAFLQERLAEMKAKPGSEPAKAEP